MNSDKALFKAGYHKLLQSLQRRWLKNKENETLEHLIAQGMASYRYTSELDAALLVELEWQLKVDLVEFIKAHRQNPSLINSPHYLAIESTFWQWALAISDKCQLEWIELAEDIKHDGLYQTDDIVGLGQFLCLNCSKSVAIYHPQALPSCSQCQGVQFRRIAFSP